MKKMKKSLKYVLISLSLVFIFAAVAVATVFLLKKPTSSEGAQFSEKQLILLDKISNNNATNSASNELTMVESASLVDETGTEISQNDVCGYYDNYVVVLDEDGNKLIYLKTQNGYVNVFKNMKECGQLDDGAFNVCAEKVKNANLLYSYNTKIENQTFKFYEIASLSSFSVINSIKFVTDDFGSLYDENGQLISNLEINLYDDYFEILYNKNIDANSYSDDEIQSKYIKSLYDYNLNFPSKTFEYESKNDFLSSEVKSLNENVIVRVFETGDAEIVYFSGSEQNSFEYDAQEGFSYSFYPVNFGVFVEKQRVAQINEHDDAVLVDGKYVIYSYEFFDINTNQLSEYSLDVGSKKASFATIDEFVIVYQQSKDYLALSESGTIVYVDKSGEKIVSYDASSINSTILYSNNSRFVTCDGIFETKKQTKATKVFSFVTSDRKYLLSDSVIDSDYFVVRDEVTKLSYICNMSGEIVYSEPFVSIISFGEGYFVASKNGQRYLCNPKDDEKTLIENYVGHLEINLARFNIYLTQEAEEVYSIYNYKNELIESGVTIEIVCRENYVALIASKDGNSKIYNLKLGNDFGESVYDYSNSDSLNYIEEIENEASNNIQNAATSIYATCEHSVTTWTVVNPATCVATGTKRGTCSICGETVTETIPIDSSAHLYEEDTEKPSKSNVYANATASFVSSANTMSSSSDGKENSEGNIVLYSYPKIINVQISSFDYYSQPSAQTETAYCQYDVQHTTSQRVASYSYLSNQKTSYNSGEIKTIKFTATESNGVITYSGELGTISCTNNFTVVGQYGNLSFSYFGTLGSFYNPSIIDAETRIVWDSSASNMAYFQPQETIKYSIVAHKDTPYWEDTSNNHVHSLITDKTIEGINYFAWTNRPLREVYWQTGEPSAYHYEFAGWKLGSTYEIATGTGNTLSAFDGYALGVHWNNCDTPVNIYPVWKGSDITINFLTNYNSYIYVQKTNEIKREQLTDDDVIDDGSFWTDSDDVYISADKLTKKVSDAFKNVEPFNLHATIESTASQKNNENDSVVSMKRYFHIGWLVCTSEGETIETYNNFTKPSTTFESDYSNNVYVVALFRIREFNVEVVGTENNESSWLGLSTVGTGVSASINDEAIGFVDKSTVWWNYSGEGTNVIWNSFEDGTPNFADKGNDYVYFKVDINVKNKDGSVLVTNKEAARKYYKFTTITFDNYYDFGGELLNPRMFTLNADGSWSISGDNDNNIEVVENYSGAASVVFQVNIKVHCEWWDYLFAQNKSGCTIKVGDLQPVYDDTKTKTTYEVKTNNYVISSSDSSISSAAMYESVEIFNVGAGKNAENVISSADGKNYYYSERSFTTISGSKVDKTNYYNNTHMLVLKPKTQRLSTLIPGAVKSSYLDRLITTSYISSIKATMNYQLNSKSLDNDLENEYLEREANYQYNIDLRFFEYHKISSTMKTLSETDTVVYGGKTYILQNVIRMSSNATGYGIRCDVYVGKVARDGAVSPYEDEYAYFFFYNGQIKFNVTMSNIDFGEMSVDLSNTGELNSETAQSGEYKNFSNLADVQMTKLSRANGLMQTIATAPTTSSPNSNKISELFVDKINMFKIIPEDGFLIESITIKLTPKDSTIGTEPLYRTYTLDYKNIENSAISMTSTEFMSLRYYYEDINMTYNGETFNIQDLCYLQFATMGYNTDWITPIDDESKETGAVWIGVTKLIDDIEVSYTVVSYFDVLFEQLNYMDVNSYLKYQNISNDFDKADYQSDFYLEDGLKDEGAWFRDMTLSQIYISGAKENIIVPNEENLNSIENYYYKTRLHKAGGSDDIAFVYNEILGYKINGNTYFSVLDSSSSDQVLVTLDGLDGIDYSTGNVSVSIGQIKQAAYESGVVNLNKYALSQNALIANYYADPIQYTLEYGATTETLYYDRAYTLKKYADAAASSYSAKTGYSFVGWVSKPADEFDFSDFVTAGNAACRYDENYGYLFTDETALASLIGSNWYISRTSRGFANYLDGCSVTISDFYVDGAQIITDSGIYEAQHYNFWGVGAQSAGEHQIFKNDGSGTMLLYPVWMANDYTLKFDLQDSQSGSTYGSTKALFRAHLIRYDYIQSIYNQNLNNGFNFELSYDAGIYNKIKLVTTSGITQTANSPELYVYVRFDTSDWYFSDSDANKAIYYQNFFRGDSVNVDRYGYSLANWIMGTNEEFADAQLFDLAFYNKSTINEISNIMFDYAGNPNSGNIANKKMVYSYGENGVNFELEKCEGASGYEGAKILRFITNRLTNSTFRTAEIQANWNANDYRVKVIKGSQYFEFIDGQNYEYGGLEFSGNHTSIYYMSMDAFAFDAADDAENSLINILKVKPYRKGYDFAGWTFAYNEVDETNMSAMAQTNAAYLNYWYEQLYYESNDKLTRTYVSLNNDILNYYNYYLVDNSEGADLSSKITNILFYGTDSKEVLGDVDRDNVHFVKLYANWTPMVYRVDVDLNIPEGYEDVTHNAFAGFFESLDGTAIKVLDTNGLFVDGIVKDGFEFNDSAIASFNYMKNGTTYKGLISNIAFKIVYGEAFRDASLEIEVDVVEDEIIVGSETLILTLSDLYVSINNHEFAGWQLWALDDNGEWKAFSDGKIDVSSEYFNAYISDWQSVSNYGELTIDDIRVKIQRDYVVETSGESVVTTERLYVENEGIRYYLTALDNVLSDGTANNKFAFDDHTLKIIISGEEYVLYSNASGGYYVKEGDSSNIVDLTAAQKQAFLDSDLMSDFVVDDSKSFTLKALWNELETVPITATNDNNASTGKVYYNGAYHYIVASKRTNGTYGLYLDGNVLNFTYAAYSYATFLTYDGEYLNYGSNRVIPLVDGSIVYQSIKNGYIENNEMTKSKFGCVVYTSDGRVELNLSSFDITKMHHFEEVSSNANPGLGGIYEIVTDDNTLVSDNEIVENADGTYSQSGNDEYWFELSYKYAEEFILNILPYHNGRYLTELTFEFYVDVYSDDNKYNYSNFMTKTKQKYQLVFDLFFDSDNRTLGIESVKLYCADMDDVWCIINKKGTLSIENYLSWWKDSTLINSATSKNVTVFNNFIKENLSFILPDLAGDNFISVGDYIDASSGDSLYGRQDINKVSLIINNLKKDINVKAKFAVQTYDMNFYSLLNNTYDAQINTEGESIATPYDSIDALEADIENRYTTISSEYTFNANSGNYPKFVTIKTDINQNIGTSEETSVETYNVPYGYFAYGYNLSSNFVGDRPIDQEFVKNPVYGFEYIYSYGYYNYALSDLSVNAENSDLVNYNGESGLDYSSESNKYLAQNSLILGSSTRYAQSLRADKELIYYNFGGLFFISGVDSEGVKFRGVSADDENTPLNKNTSIYAYYYIKTSATEAGFFAWDDASMSYKRIEDIKNGFVYQSRETLDDYYDINEDGSLYHITGKPSGNVMYTFEELGIDTEKFARDFSIIKTFANNELKEEYMAYLRLISQTYWFIARGEATLDISLDTVGLKFSESQNMFYLGDDYYALQFVRDENMTYYGASLYKKASVREGYYELVEDAIAYDPTTESLDDYVVLNNYYVLYDGEYYKIDYYSIKQGNMTYYNPYQKQVIQNDVIIGNKVVLNIDDGTGKKIPTTYYFDFETLKLYEPDMLGVEATDISYKIVTASNSNYDISVTERESGYGLYGITLNSIPDASVGFWMAETDFLFWAGITTEKFDSMIEYQAGGGSGDGKVFTALVNKYKESNPTEENLNKFISELNGKIGSFTFDDLIRPGILVKGFTDNSETGLVEQVELQFVVDMWFSSVSKRVSVNVSETFDVLMSGADMSSSLYAVQVYQRTNFDYDSYEAVNNANAELTTHTIKVKEINARYFEYVGDTIKYYNPENHLKIIFVSNYDDILGSQNQLMAIENILNESDYALYSFNYDDANKTYSFTSSYYEIYNPIMIFVDVDENGYKKVLAANFLN